MRKFLCDRGQRPRSIGYCPSPLQKWMGRGGFRTREVDGPSMRGLPVPAGGMALSVAVRPSQE